MKMSSATDTKEGRDANQENLEKLEKSTHEQLMKFNKSEWKMLQLGWGNLRHKTGRRTPREEPCGEGLRGSHA